MDERIARVKDKLLLLQNRPLPEEMPFGVEAHLYRMKPPLSSAALESFEDAHHVRLPEDYRAFLLHVGNGGAGPYYGILPLQSWDDIYHDELEDELNEDPDVIGRALVAPCPIEDNLIFDGWEDSEENYRWNYRLPHYEYSPFQGTITICDQGCTYYSILVVSGNARGRVCNVDLDWCVAPNLAPFPDFLSWYEAWLDRSLSGEDPTLFGRYHKRG